MNTHRRAGMTWTIALPTLLFAWSGGCSQPQPAPLTPQTGLGARMQKPMDADPLSGADQPGALYDSSRTERASGEDVEQVSTAVQQNVTGPGASDEQLRPSTTRAAATSTAPTTSASASSGQYYTLGGVLAEVNGTPIYANKVLALLEPVLAKRARELDARQFKVEATKELTGQMMTLRDNQLEYAAAERNLDEREKELADQMTLQWRQRQITEAGGSLELARKNAAEIARRNRLTPGSTFEELVAETYRVMMRQIFLNKRIYPRIQVNANDQRAYYDRNRDRMFTERGKARFRLIKIDVRKAGGADQAQRKASELRNRIVKAGEPFDEIARTINDDDRLLRSGGDLGGAIEQGAFAIDKVEKAAWATNVGEVAPIVDTGEALYLVKVEEKVPGRVLPFEDEAVQKKIRDALESEQFITLQQQFRENLIRDAVVRSSADMMNVALDMAMQNYPRWSGK
jgi:parvulin-like peptidyl-prolyl isomerase